MRLEHLFEDIHSDQTKLSNANKAFDDFMFELRGHIELSGYDEFESFEKTYQEILQKVFTFTFKLKYKDEPIGIRILPATSMTKHKLGVLRTTSIDDGYNLQFNYEIHMYDNTEDFELISIKDFYRQIIRNFKKVFIHEFVHFIDAVESDHTANYMATKRNLRQKGNYINTPHEYNAFYIQMMSEINDAFEDESVVRTFLQNPTYDRFLSLINVETHAGEMLKDLEGKYRKAFKKRLFQLYNAFLEKYTEDKDD